MITLYFLAQPFIRSFQKYPDTYLMALQKMGALIALLKLSLILSFLHHRQFEAYLKGKYEKELTVMQEKHSQQNRVTNRLTKNAAGLEGDDSKNLSAVLPSKRLLPEEDSISMRKEPPHLSFREVFSFESFKQMYDGYHDMKYELTMLREEVRGLKS